MKNNETKWEEESIEWGIRFSQKDLLFIKKYVDKAKEKAYQKGKEEGRKELIEEIKEVANHTRPNLLLNEIINI